jgi:hypothetical protein
VLTRSRSMILIWFWVYVNSYLRYLVTFQNRSNGCSLKWPNAPLQKLRHWNLSNRFCCLWCFLHLTAVDFWTYRRVVLGAFGGLAIPHVCHTVGLSVHTLELSRDPLHWFLWKLMLESIQEICLHIAILVIVGQEITCCMKTYMSSSRNH